MVEVATDHAAYTRKVSIAKNRVVSESLLAIAHAVRLNIGLVNHIKSIFVAEGVPERVVWIVACSYSIDIQLFHDKNILYHVGLGNHISLVGIEFMTVCTFEQNGLAVDKELIADNLHVAETYLKLSIFCYTRFVG